MAQPTDYDQFQEDPSVSDDSGGKPSLLTKIKGKGKRLKAKLHVGSGKPSEESSFGETEDSDDDEEESPTTKLGSGGATQPESTGATKPDSVGAPQPHSTRASQPYSTGASQPHSTGATQPESKGYETPSSTDDSGLSKGFEGLSTKEKGYETPSNTDDSGLSKDFEGLSTKEKGAAGGAAVAGGAAAAGGAAEKATSSPEGGSADETHSSKPTSEYVQDKATSAKDEVKDRTFGAGTGSEQKQTSPDAPAQLSEEPEQLGDKAGEAGKTWSQWAAEKVGIAKEAAAANAPTAADGTPYHAKAYDAVVGAKDSAVGKTAAAKDSAVGNTAAAKDSAVGKTAEAKDSAAAQLPDQSSPSSDPAQQTYFQKATGGIYGAKDTLFSSTQPGEHDKALSQKVTESVGNLPATLKSSLGFGKGASSPTTTHGITPDQEASDVPQSPGLVSRITGLFGAKKPASEDSTLSSEPATPTAHATDTSGSESLSS